MSTNDTPIASYIDHTILNADAAARRHRAHLRRGRQVQVLLRLREPDLGLHRERRAGRIRGADLLGDRLPVRRHPTASKVFEARGAIADGANEIDMVINIAAAKAGDEDALVADISAIADAVHEGGAILKVIIETSMLTDDEKVLACRASVRAGADFVKTSTGFAGGGATLEDVALMRATVGPDLGVKASGGVRSLETARAMIAAGATRLGSSSGVAIVEGEQGAEGY